MKFQIREGAAASLGAAAVVARILYGVTIDLPWLYNSGWISVLLGGVLALPVALAAAQLRAASAGKSPLSALNARRPVLARLLAGMLMLTAAFDATMASMRSPIPRGMPRWTAWRRSICCFRSWHCAHGD